ncbi:hypothetical protein LUZ60_017624 [Juncus effusus]|nr:hypothetical protein LUZ60_017624 [Juncus effusus]
MTRIPIRRRSPGKKASHLSHAHKKTKTSRKASKQIPSKIISPSEKRDWQDAVCSVCLERPHNAVLLLCSSHEKGCRPYMCGTGSRLSNCLAQFKKAYTKDQSQTGFPIAGLPGKESSESVELACPLCRGQVKGWTVVDPARRYLNRKKRTCMYDKCSFKGTHKQLRHHVKSAHPQAGRTREVDPVERERWHALEREREREDVLSTIRSTMPRSVVFGDYVIDMNGSGANSSDTDNEAGMGRGGGMDGGLFYFFLREGARFLRRERENNGNSVENAIDVDDEDSEDSDAWSIDDDWLESDDEEVIRARQRRGRGGRSGPRVRFL